MTGNLQFRRGLKTNLPASAPSGMPLWCTDTKELFIGTDDGVQKVGGNGDNNSSNVDTYSKSEIDSMFSDIETLLSEV